VVSRQKFEKRSRPSTRISRSDSRRYSAAAPARALTDQENMADSGSISSVRLRQAAAERPAAIGRRKALAAVVLLMAIFKYRPVRSA